MKGWQFSLRTLALYLIGVCVYLALLRADYQIAAFIVGGAVFVVLPTWKVLMHEWPRERRFLAWSTCVLHLQLFGVLSLVFAFVTIMLRSLFVADESAAIVLLALWPASCLTPLMMFVFAAIVKWLERRSAAQKPTHIGDNCNSPNLSS